MSENKPPELQEWIAAAGSYWAIDWAAWDRAVAAYKAERSKQIIGNIDRSRRQKEKAA
jgi:hypothetical protein